MADSSVKIDSRDSEARVAFELMQHIASEEFNDKQADRVNRDYWLTLYHQCRQAVKGSASLDLILKKSRS